MTIAQENELATLLACGLATPAQTDALLRVSRKTALAVARVAVSEGHLLRDDVEDVAQAAIIKAWRRAKTWDLSRSSWRTFVAVIARSAVGDQRRRYAADDNLRKAAEENQDLLTDP